MMEGGGAPRHGGSGQVREAYRYWRRLLLRSASERGLEIRTLVDLMCGTGNTAIPWTRRAGWRVIGVERNE